MLVTMKKNKYKGLLLLAFFCFSGCSSVDKAFYQPDRKAYRTPKQDGLEYEDARFRSRDGTSLTGWFIPATTPAVGTVIHFHGNAQNMSAHYAFVSWLPKNRFNLFVFDYRGYGASAGSPTRRGVYEDAVAAIRYIKSRKDIDQSKIILVGQSLGGANAILAAGHNQFDGIAGVVIDSAFSSYEDVAEDHLGSMSSIATVMVKDDYSPIEAVGKISPVPLLIMHGKADRVVPFYHGKRLYDKANEPKQMWTVNNGRHTEALGKYKKEVIPRLYKQLLSWVGGSAPQNANGK